MTFFKIWYAKIADTDRLLYDLTSISSYSECNPSLAWGKNKDGEKLPQINYAMLVGQDSGLPIYFSTMNGNINDVSTLNHLLKTIEKLGFSAGKLVMDRGFCSKENIDDMLARNYKFLQAVRINANWICDLVEVNRDMLADPDALHIIDKRYYYIRTVKYIWKSGTSSKSNSPVTSHRCTVHIYYSQDLVGNDRDRLMLKLQQEKQRLEQNSVEKPDPVLAKYFIITRPKYARSRIIEYNTQAIEKHNKFYAGFFAFITNDKTLSCSLSTLEIYRKRDAIEKVIDDLKNDLDMKRLRVHEGKRMDARLFLQFLALIYYCEIRKRLKKSTLNNKFTVREALSHLKTITESSYVGKYKNIYSTLSKTHTDILSALSIKTPWTHV